MTMRFTEELIGTYQSFLDWASHQENNQRSFAYSSEKEFNSDIEIFYNDIFGKENLNNITRKL